MNSNIIAVANATIPKRRRGVEVVKRSPGVSLIMTEVLDAIKEGNNDVKRFAPYLRGSTVYETCRNVWDFVKGTIQYKIDPDEYQDVKEPAATWREKVCDCKSYTVLIASCLIHLGIAPIVRFVDYAPFSRIPTHVYVVVVSGGRKIVLDCVMPAFDREHGPITYKKDVFMQLRRISGIGLLNNDAGVQQAVNYLEGGEGSVYSGGSLGPVVKPPANIHLQPEPGSVYSSCADGCQSVEVPAPLPSGDATAGPAPVVAPVADGLPAETLVAGDTPNTDPAPKKTNWKPWAVVGGVLFGLYLLNKNK